MTVAPVWQNASEDKTVCDIYTCRIYLSEPCALL